MAMATVSFGPPQPPLRDGAEGNASLPSSPALPCAVSGFTTQRCLVPTVVLSVPATPGATAAVMVALPVLTAVNLPPPSTVHGGIAGGPHQIAAADQRAAGGAHRAATWNVSPVTMSTGAGCTVTVLGVPDAQG